MWDMIMLAEMSRQTLSDEIYSLDKSDSRPGRRPSCWPRDKEVEYHFHLNTIN